MVGSSCMSNFSDSTRRKFLTGIGLLAAGCSREAERGGPTPPPDANTPADVRLGIGPVLVDIAKDHTISTIGYNGSVPGPLIRMKEGVPVTVEIFNDTDTSELVHWHGQNI